MKYVCIILFLSIAVQGQAGTCPAGQFMNGNGTCSDCPPGTFMSESNHTNFYCNDCSTIEDNVTVYYPCNATINTGCPIGSFQTDEDPLLCQKCRVCKVHVAQSCSPTSDSICCDSENMTLVKKNNDSDICKDKSNHGQFCCEFESPATSTTVPNDKSATMNERLEVKTTSTVSESTKHVTCPRNMYRDQTTNSCNQCDLCSYIDQEAHSQQACDLCNSDKPKSRLVYCPKRCVTQSKGLGDMYRVLISYLTGIILPFVVIPVSFAVMSLCINWGSP